jgi:hypothetical protein
MPGFVHDICSAVHPFAVISPFFQSLPLATHGLEWISPPVMLAHPLDDRPAVRLYASVERTADALGSDGPAYRALFDPLVESWPNVADSVLGPLRWPRHPLALAHFGSRALQPATTLAARAFAGARARALFGGIAAHSMIPLEKRPTGGVALALTLAAHVGGWCLPRGGAQRVADALAAHVRSLGGEIVTDTSVKSIDELPPAKAILCDLSPQPLLRIAGHRFPSRFRRALERYRYGMGVFKWIGHSTGRSHGPMKHATAQARSISEVPSRTLPRPRDGPGTAVTQTDLSCSSRSRRSSTPRAPRSASTQSGPTATFRTIPTPTCCRASSNRSSVTRLDFATESSLEQYGVLQISSGITRISSAAISRQARRHSISSSLVQRGAPIRRPCEGCISAPRRRRLVSACMACAAISPLSGHFVRCWAID